MTPADKKEIKKLITAAKKEVIKDLGEVVGQKVLTIVRAEISEATGAKYGKTVCPRCKEESEPFWKPKMMVVMQPECAVCTTAMKFVEVTE